MIPAIILFFGLTILPESPRWLAKHDRWDEALHVLALVHAHGDENNVFVKREMAEIREEVEFYRKNSDVTWTELFKPSMLNRVHIGAFTQVCLVPSFDLTNLQMLTWKRFGPNSPE